MNIRLYQYLLIIMVSVMATPLSALRILFAVEFFPSETEFFILNQITTLIDRGHDVHIHSYQKPRSLKVDAAIKKYDLLAITTYGTVCPYGLDSFDILYAQFGIQGNKLLKQKKAEQSGTPLVTCFRGYDLTERIQKYPDCYKELLQQGDLFLPVSSAFADILYKLGAAPEKTIVHHSAIDLSVFTYRGPRARKNNEPIQFISVSRLIEKKGIEYAIDAFKKVHDKYPNTIYTIVGSGVLEKELRARVARYGLEQVVHFTGTLTHAEVHAHLMHADCMLLPAVVAKNGNADGIPNVLKEAMAIGLPVITTLQPSIQELVQDRVSGLLVPERNSEALAAAMIEIILHPTWWEFLGRAGNAKIVSEYNIESMITVLERYFVQLVHS